MAKLFLLEDEVELREELAAFFRAHGHGVVEAGSIAEFRACLAAYPDACEIALIDRGLPDGDGLSLVNELSSPHIGIIVFTARTDSADKIDGLERGVDYYVSKPAKLPELGAIVTAMTRRLPQKNAWQLVSATHALTAPHGVVIPLTTLEYDFVHMLARTPNQPVSRRTIVEGFGEDYLQYDQNRLDTMVRRLRQKIEKESAVVLPIHTVRAFGFVFSAPIDVHT